MSPAQAKRKVLLIGWDAADWKTIDPLMEAGKMPNLQRLVERGAMAQIATLHPPLSPMLWTSIATGKRPFKHGIHGFSEPTHDGRGVQPVTNLSRTSKAIWNILQQNDIRSTVIGWWPSHPAEPISGVMISDHFHRASGPLKNGWPLRHGAVHPERLTETLAELRMHPEELAREMVEAFVPTAATIDPKKDKRIMGMCNTLCECVSIHSAATWLLDNEPWDFFAVYYDAIDHFCHGFMKYHPPQQSWIRDEDFAMYQGVVAIAYQFHDQMLGTLLAKAGEGVDVILMSDHGFHPDHLRPKAIPDIPAGPAIEHSDFGILVMAGDGFRKDELIHGASVLDITPTLLAMYGLPVGDDMDGKVLTGAFAQAPAIASIPSWEEVAGDDGRHPPNTRLDPVAAKEALDQLVALGYIEALPDNAEVAVSRTVRELQYNLCESYQDADRHADAVEIARHLHEDDPDEQRFAVKRFVSCQALGYVDEMRSIVDDLGGRRRALFHSARKRIAEYQAIGKERAAARKAAATEEETETQVEKELAGASPEKKREPLFTDEERKELEVCRNHARLQPAVIDYLQAQVLTAEKKWLEALECLGRVQQADLVRPGLLLQAAALYQRLNLWDQAEQTYVKALEIDPNNAHAHLGMCRVALRKREFETAAQSALECLQRLYHYPMAHYLLGVALTGARDYKRAAEALAMAIALNPNFPQAHIRLARLLKNRLNDAAGAANHMQAYRETHAHTATQRQQTSTALPQAPVKPVAIEAPAVQLGALGDGIVVVCGLPRSGTSVVMQMLAAGGMPILTDDKRTPDEDNPLGYFEFEPVKLGRDYASWIEQAAGKAMKVVSPLISHLPPRVGYRVILIERDVDEVLASQTKMIERRGEHTPQSAERQSRLRQQYLRLRGNVEAALRGHDEVEVLSLLHSAVMQSPDVAAHRINLFCGGSLDEAAMAACVRPELHRQKAI